MFEVPEPCCSLGHWSALARASRALAARPSYRPSPLLLRQRHPARRSQHPRPSARAPQRSTERPRSPGKAQARWGEGQSVQLLS
eukprot:1880125-Alexandrium_andersonii.AAC.1